MTLCGLRRLRLHPVSGNPDTSDAIASIDRHNLVSPTCSESANGLSPAVITLLISAQY
jgi:hypothetical protein